MRAVTHHGLLLATSSILLVPFLVSAQTDPALLRFVHPDAKALISIDWKRVRQSHLGTMIRQKWVDGSTVPGIEFLNDIDRVVISSPGRGSAPADTSASADTSAEEAPLLIILGGRFDLAKVRGTLLAQGAKPQMFNNVQVYRPQGKTSKEMAFVLLDPQTILIGDPVSIFASLERTAFPTAAPDPNTTLARAAQLDTNYDAWALITAPGVLAGDRLMGMLTGSDLTSEARGFEIGCSLRDGLTFASTVMFQSEAVAKRMGSELSKLLKLAVKDKIGDPATLDLEKKLKVASEGGLLKIAMHLTQQELDKNAQLFALSQQATAQRKPVAPPAADPRPLALPVQSSPPSEKKVIRIEGLDEGTREIPYRQ